MPNFIPYKKICIKNSEGEVKPLVDNEGKFLVLDEYIDNYIPFTEIEKVLRYPIVNRFFKLYALHEDETIREDITSYVSLNGSLEKKYQQGQTRSLSIDFKNSNNLWNPSPVKGKRLFANSKFKLVMGLTVGKYTYWVDEGIFVCQDPTLNNSDDANTLSIELFDKFALLDGTISGKTESDYELPVGTNIYQAVRSLLRLPIDNLGHCYDANQIVFPNEYMDKVTAYTIKKTAGNTIGEILIDIANSISCDIYYDEIGRLTFRNNLDDLDFHNRKIGWNYRENQMEFKRVTRKDEWSKIKNKYIVIGSNINGLVCKGIAENTNPASPYNINGNFGIKPEIIEDNLINSTLFCTQRAKYELKKNTMRNTTVSFESMYVPHLSPTDLVHWSCEDYGYHNQPFLVESVSIPLDPKEWMSITLANVNELPL